MDKKRGESRTFMRYISSLFLTCLFLVAPAFAALAEFENPVREQLETGRYNEAITLLNKYIEADPTNAYYYRFLGSAYLRGLNNCDEAIRYLKKATELDPTLVESRIETALALEKKGYTEEAASLYTEALEFDMNRYWEQIARSHLEAIEFTAKELLFKDWLVAGPFDNSDLHGLDKPYPPEALQDYGGWRRVFNRESFGYVDLNELFMPNDFVVAYCKGYLYSPNRRRVQLRVGSDDGIMLWLNDEMILRRDHYRSAVMDQESVPVTLREGWNKVLMKVSETWGDWGVYFRVTDAKGRPASGLIFSPRPHEESASVEAERLKYEFERRQRFMFVLYAFGAGLLAAGCYFFFSNIRRRVIFNSMRFEFISNVLHELNSPLTAIRLSAETLNRRTAKASGQGEGHCDVIIQESHRLGMFIDNLHDFSLLRRGRGRLPLEEGDINDIVDDVIRLIKLQDASGEHEIVFERAESLPKIPLHKSAMTQALINLINNAMRYSDKEKKVWVSALARGRRLIIEVKDRGVGISKKEIRHIFEKFYRSQEAEGSDRKGSGIGLFIAKMFVEAQGGRIAVASRLNEGSTFSIILPLR